MNLMLNLWKMVKISSPRKPTTKRKTLSWGTKGESQRKQSFNNKKQGHKSLDG